MTRMLLTLGPSTGGIGHHVRHIYDALTAQGWRVRVVGPPAHAEGWMEGLGDDFRPLSLPGPWGPVRSLFGPLTEECRDADLVHAHGLRTGLVTAVAARRAGTPAVVTVHNRVLPETGGRFWRFARWAEPLTGRAATVALGPSPDVAERLGQSARTIPVVPRHIPKPSRDRLAVRQELGLERDDVAVFCLARFQPQKRLDVLVKAAALMVSPRVKVFLAGDGPLQEKIAAQVEAAGAPIRFLGYRKDVPDLLGAADIAVLSSAWEASPLALHESAWARLPLVGTDTGGIPLIIQDGETGFVVPVGDASALATALDRLAGDAGLRRQMGDAAWAREEAEFSGDKMMERLSVVYEEVLSSGSGGSARGEAPGIVQPLTPSVGIPSMDDARGKTATQVPKEDMPEEHGVEGQDV